MNGALSVSVQYAAEGAPPRALVRALLKSALPGGGEITVRFVAPEEMAEFNLRFRNKTGVADVLSFAYHAPGAPVLGDIIVCPAAAEKTAKIRGCAVKPHVARLVVHGALHVAGMRHDTDAAAQKMESAERGVLSQCGIAKIL